ncbi:MAG: sporulation protein YqfD [Clostridiales bacterium]|nr:sporulation protein YqfD [Clostridiales bacterium]
MKKIVNYLRGSVTITVTGVFPERFLNLCAQRALLFWGLTWLDPYTLRLSVPRRDARGLEDIAARTGCTVQVDRRQGLPFFLRRFRRRYALLAGLALSLVAVGFLSRFVLVLEVTCNAKVPTAAILSALEQQGVRPGVYGPSIDNRAVGHRVLMALPELSFMAINLYGIRAEIVVREADPRPEVVDVRSPSNVYAAATGIVTRMEVLNGTPLFDVGDTVLKGELLISGVVDIKEPEYSSADLGVRLVHAQGRVYARTWRTLHAVIPLEAEVKYYTGREESRYSMTVFGRRINFGGNSSISFPKYDKINTCHTLTLPGGQPLPFSIRKETCRAYDTLPLPIDIAQASALLETRLWAALHQAVGEEGEVLRADFTAAERGDGLFTVTLLAECREQIGRVVPLDTGT